MSRVKFFILSVLIFSLSSLTISAKVISYCLDKKYSQLNETNHVHSNKSCHSQSNDIKDVCFNCECYYTQINIFQSFETKFVLNLFLIIRRKYEDIFMQNSSSVYFYSHKRH